MQKHSSFLILFPALALGIFLGSQGHVRMIWLVLFVLTLLLWFYASFKNLSVRYLHWAVLALGMFMIGQFSIGGRTVWDSHSEREYFGLVYSVKTLTFDKRVLVKLKHSKERVALHLPRDEKIQEEDLISFTAVIKPPPRAANPGAFCYNEFLAKQGVFGVAYPQVYTIESAQGYSLLSRIRLKIQNNLRGKVKDPSLVLALVLGEREGLTEERRDFWRRLGISHLLAISGMHVGLLALLVGFALQRFAIKDAWKIVLTQLLVLSYIILAGSGSSAKRAFFTGCLASYGNLRRKRVDPLHLWALVGWLLLLGQPSLIFEAGFTMSFAASGGIILWASSLRWRIKNRLLAHGLNSLVVSIIAQLSLLPLLIYYFGEVAILGPISTLLFLPLVIVLLVGGLGVAIGLGTIGFAPIVNQTMAIVHALERLLLPYAWQWVPKQLTLFQLILWWLFFIYAGWRWRKPRITKPVRTRIRFTKILVGLIAITSLPPFIFRPLEITALNIGQGDSFYIRTPQGKHILIDGGGDSLYWQERGRNVGLERLVPYLQYRQVDRLDYLILSHPHEDHLFGLLAVLENFEVGMVIDNGQEHTSLTYLRYLELIDTKEIPYYVAKAGDKIKLSTNLWLTVLYPSWIRKDIPSPFNNNSLLLRIDYGGIGALFTGDLESPTLYDLAQDPTMNLEAQWIKVPHHGSRGSFVADFYKRVNPTWAVIPVGENSFGHPHHEVLDFLDKEEINWVTTKERPQSFLVWWGLWGRLRPH